jgi:Gametolysin peptidase M11
MSARLFAAALAACVVAGSAGAALEPDPRARDALGDLPVLVVRATWGPQPVAAGDLSGAAAFYERASFGKLKLKIAVTPWLRAYSEPICPGEATTRSVFGRVGELAQVAAARAGFDVSSYGRIAYILPERMCSVAGLGVGREVFMAQDGGLLDDVAFVHELGHTFGLPHAQGSACARGCRIFEYGDPLSPMGGGGVDFTGLEKLKLGWIDGVQRVAGAGTYSLAVTRPLVVTTAAGEYWIEPRTEQLVVRLVKPNDALHPVYLRSIYLAEEPQRYVARGVFSVNRAGQFHWLDKRRPSMPRVRALDQTVLWWTRSADRDSGVAEYRVTIDGKLLKTTTAETNVTLPQLRGPHRVAVVAVDRAGNRSRPGTVLLRFS